MRRTMKWTGSSGTHVFVSTLAAILAVAALARAFWPLPAPEIIESAAEDLNPMEFAPNAFAVVDEASHYAIVTEKPLFTTDRKPYSAPEPVAAPVSRPAATAPVEASSDSNTGALLMEVIGIIDAPGASLALVRVPGSAETRRLMIDDIVDGWTVIQIQNNKLVLRQADEERTVYLVQPRPGHGAQ